MKRIDRPRPAKWVPRDHPKYLEEIEKVDVPLTRVLGATLFMRPRSRGENEALLTLWQRFLARAEPKLQWWYDSSNSRVRPFEDRYREFPANVLNFPSKDLTYWNVHSGERARDAAKLRFYAATQAAAAIARLDSLFWCMPDSSNPLDLVEEALEFARSTPVRHGTLGVTLGLPAHDKWRLHYPDMFVFASRYHGLDLPQTFERETCIKGISTTNWVTFVHQSFLKKLGGAEKLRKKLSNEIVFHEILEGVAIQAGAAPQLGDVNAGEDLPLYREVGRALAPIRAKTGLHDETRQLGGPDYQRNNFNTEETTEWLARFER